MFSPTETFESTTHPGVSFTLKRVGIGLKREIQLKLAKNNLQQRVAIAEIQSIAPKDANGDISEDFSVVPFDQQKRILELETERTELLIDERLQWFRDVVVSIDKPATGESIAVEDFIAYGPEDLFSEINDKVQDSFGITPDQAKNSLRPPTSQQVEDGPKKEEISDSQHTRAENASGDTNT